jgi:hypothetical protein
MSIFSVSVDLTSETLGLEELTDFAGRPPSRGHSKGDRRSKRLPDTKVFEWSVWSLESKVALDSWTLVPHWPTISPVLESIAAQPKNDEVSVTLSIGTNSRAMGYAFDLLPEDVALLARANCGVWIDSYAPNRDHEDRPDDYPYPEGGTLLPPGPVRRLRRRMNLAIRTINPLGKVRRHKQKSATRSVRYL